MKFTVNRTLKALTLVLFVSLFSATFNTEDYPNAKKIAVIDFDTEVIDYGTVIQNSDGERVFKFTNTGDAPLIISKVKTSCGCTVPTYSKEPILPGAQGQLDIKYDTKRLGAFTKTITVTSNAKEGSKKLKIKGNIVAQS